MATGRVPTTANSPLTAKGDLFGYSTTQARVAVGNDGETLVADSSTSTGLRYSPAPAVGNPVINSAFQIWQRGTSFTSTGYIADRWFGNINSGITLSRQLTNDTTNLPNIQYCVRLARNSGSTALVYPQVTNSFETVNTYPYIGKTITFSFYARRGANFSAAGNEISAYVQTGTGTDQNCHFGYTGEVNVAGSNNVVLTTTWQRFSYTGTVPANATEMGIKIFALTTGTAGANDWYEITGTQIDIGSVALPFRTYAATIQGELAACQRYYFRYISDGAYSLMGNGMAHSTTTVEIQIPLPVVLRVAPPSIEYSTLAVFDGSTVTTVNAASLQYNNRQSGAILVSVTSGLTTFRPYHLLSNNSTSAYIAFSAEL